MDDGLLTCSRWLEQGDLFAAVPLPVPVIDYGFSWDVEHGPALLLSNGCQIDKKSTERLLFAPALPIEGLDGSGRQLARQDNPTPYDALRIGITATGRELYCRPSQTFWLPIELFGPSEFEEVESGEPPRRCMADAQRLGTLPPERLGLLRYKLNAFWTGLVPDVTQPPLFWTEPEHP